MIPEWMKTTVFFLVVMIIAIWLLISKVGDLIAVASQNIDASAPIADALTQAISKLDTLCGSSGLK